VYLGAANVVVLPYRDILNSGSALLALSLSRPILVPHLGAMEELKDDFGDLWVQTFKGVLTAGILQNALDWGAQPRPSICPMPERYDWPHIASETLRFYEKVISVA
jgi:hypothetical protein